MGGAYRFGGIKIDYLKLAEFLSRNRKLECVNYYNSIPNNPENDPDIQKGIDKQLGFYSFLEHSGFKTTIIPLKMRTIKCDCWQCGKTISTEKPQEKGVDVALATDMLSLAIDGAYDVAILVSGDYDYHKAVEAIKKRSLCVEIAYFKNCGITPEFIQLADRFIDLGTSVEKIRFTK